MKKVEVTFNWSRDRSENPLNRLFLCDVSVYGPPEDVINVALDIQRRIDNGDFGVGTPEVKVEETVVYDGQMHKEEA
jgi:hypothetical protein